MAKSKLSRLQFDATPEQLNAIEELGVKIGTASRAGTVWKALKLLAWIKREQENESEFLIKLKGRKKPSTIVFWGNTNFMIMKFVSQNSLKNEAGLTLGLRLCREL